MQIVHNVLQNIRNVLQSTQNIQKKLQNLQKIFNKIGNDISDKKNNKLSKKIFNNKKEISIKRLN